MNDATTVLGIDLGTTYSCVAYANENGNPVIAKNREGTPTTPSVVHFDIDDPSAWDAGQVAKDNALIEPERTVSFVKRIIGTTPVAISVDGKDYSPEEISAFVLKKVAGDAAITMPMSFDGCVITVPAYFGDAEKKATLAAAQIAGLNTYGLVQEPVAAAIEYGCDRTDKDETVIVYDLGGGTFDVSVVAISHGADGATHIDVVCNDGDKNLGGGDWDAEVVKYIQNEFEAATGYEDEFDEYARQAFQDEAERLKIQLSSKKQASAVFNITGKPVKITLTVDDFNDITESLLDKTMDITRSCLDNARGKGYEASRILLVGGSTKMPQITNRLASEFPELVQEVNDPDEAVAKGAVRYALQLAAGIAPTPDGSAEELKVTVVDPVTNKVVEQKSVSENNIAYTFGATDGIAQPIVIQTVTSKSYGVKVTDAATGVVGINNLILKNQRIDHSLGYYEATGRYGTAVDGQQSVFVEVFENDFEVERIEDEYEVGREPLGTASIDLSMTNLPANSPIDVRFVLNEEGMLNVTAVEPSSGQSCKIEFVVTGGLTEEQIRESREAITSMTMLA